MKNLIMHDVLDSLLKEKKISEIDLSRKTDLPRATIYRLRQEKTVDPRISTLTKLAEFFDITIDQLLGYSPIDKQHPANAIKIISVPIVNWHYPITLNTDSSAQSVQFAVDINANKQDYFALQVSSDAMLPNFSNDTILIVDTKRVPKNRDYVIAFIGTTHEVIFRQILTEGNKRILQAINSNFPVIQMEEQDEIIGVISCIHKSY